MVSNEIFPLKLIGARNVVSQAKPLRFEIVFLCGLPETLTLGLE